MSNNMIQCVLYTSPTHKISDKCSTGALQRLFQSRNIVCFSLLLVCFYFVVFKQQVLHDFSLTG